MKSNPVKYDGRAGKIFGIMIVNFFLSILTLGIYSFWGKTRLRRYLLSSVSVNGKDRLQYTGTPLELLFGWLKAMIFVVPTVVVLVWAANTQHYVIYLIALGAFYLLFYLGTYLALRYRFTRTRWRGIAFGLRGKASGFMKLSLIRAVLNTVTLGYLIPVSDIKKWHYIANNMHFGKKMMAYKGSAKSLIVVNLVTLWVPLVILAAFIIPQFETLKLFAEYAKVIETDPKAPPPPGMEKIGNLVSVFYGLLFLAYIGRLWYRAALRAERLRGLKLADIRFKSTATGFGYFKLKLINALIMLVTLGWGFAIIRNRNMRFEAETILIGGDLEQLISDQASIATKSDIGDELAPDLDMGAAISIGI